MHGLPSAFNVAPLIGRMLEQVSFTINTVHLAFDRSTSITIESCYAHAFDQGAGLVDRIQVPPKQSTLMQLIGQSITAVETQVDGTLTLKFSNGQSLSCFDDSSYEAYRLKIDNLEIVV